MLSSIPPEITIGSFSLVGVLTGYIWNKQSKQLNDIEKHIESCPFPCMKSDIATMKNDIKWIKEMVKNRNL
jgi:hypothetical protein